MRVKSNYVDAILQENYIYKKGKYFNFFVNFNFFLITNSLKMAANNIPQPPIVNYNQTATYWTDEQCFYLLNQRMYRNREYWELPARLR